MIRHQMPFDDLALLLPGQGMEDFPQLTTRLPEPHFAPSLRASHIMRTFWGPPLFIIVGILFLEDLSVLFGG
jgi:hypothetical protein